MTPPRGRDDLTADVTLVCSYDPVADAAYIYFDHPIPAGVVDQVDTDHGAVNVDLDAGGRILGVEVIGARRRLPAALLRAISPHRPERET